MNAGVIAVNDYIRHSEGRKRQFLTNCSVLRCAVFALVISKEFAGFHNNFAVLWLSGLGVAGKQLPVLPDFNREAEFSVK